MNPKIFKGRTVEEATEEALKTLNEELENLEIKILDTGRNGILGLGGHPAEIEVHILGGSKSESEKPKKSTRKPLWKAFVHEISRVFAWKTSSESLFT